MKAASVVQDMLHELPRYLLVLAAVSVLALLAQAAAPSSASAPSPIASPDTSPMGLPGYSPRPSSDLIPAPSPTSSLMASGRDARPAPDSRSFDFPLASRGGYLRASAAQPFESAVTASATHGEFSAAR